MSWPSFCLQNLLSCICSEPGGTKKVTRWLRVPILGRKVFRPEKSSTFRPKSQLMWWDCGYQHDLCLKGDFWINFKRKIKWCCHDLKVIAHKSNPFCCEIKTYYRFFKIRVKHIDFKWPSCQLKNTVMCTVEIWGNFSFCRNLLSALTSRPTGLKEQRSTCGPSNPQDELRLLSS